MGGDRPRLARALTAAARAAYIARPARALAEGGFRLFFGRSATMYAVIKTGGKQYKVAANDVLTVERLDGEAGAKIAFDQVLMVAGEGEPRIGAPVVAGAVVEAEVVEQTRGPKLTIFKKRRRKHYRRKTGHRQDVTVVRITGIQAG